MARAVALPARQGFRARTEPFPALHRLAAGPVRAILERFFDLRVEGLEHLPEDGAYIIAANHHNYLDGVLLSIAVPRPVAFLVMPRVYRATPLHPLLHRHLGSIELSLGRRDVGGLRDALQRLEQGRVVGIFPEGPYSVRGRLERGLPGVALLALRARVPLVPAAIHGTYEALVGRRGYLPRRHPLAVRFGAARRFTPATDGDARARRADVTDLVMNDIAELLGPTSEVTPTTAGR